jgi:hypothetical protein
VTIDWLWLYAQISAVASIVLWQLFRDNRRNLYSVLIGLGLLVMVQGQAWWIFNQFEATHVATFRHLEQIITLDGARRANAYVGLGVVGFVIAFVVTARRAARHPRAEAPRPAPDPLTFEATAIAGTMLIGASIAVINLAGGVGELISLPGQSLVRGLTMFLLLAGIGKLPLLRSLSKGHRPVFTQAALFAGTVLLFLVNSRFLTVFLFLQATVIANYCWHELPRKVLLGASFVIFTVLILFGLYRDEAARRAAVDPSQGEQVELRIGAITNWFYRSNIEGFVGLAGLLSYEDAFGAVTHDLGASELRVITQFVPYPLRADPSLPVSQLASHLQSLHPHSGSIVSSGMEDAYAHFGIPGIVGLGLLLGGLANWLHGLMSDPGRNRLVIGLLSVHSLQLIRGSFFNTLFFGMGEVVIVLLLALLVGAADAMRRRLTVGLARVSGS